MTAARKPALPPALTGALAVTIALSAWTAWTGDAADTAPRPAAGAGALSTAAPSTPSTAAAMDVPAPSAWPPPDAGALAAWGGEVATVPVASTAPAAPAALPAAPLPIATATEPAAPPLPWRWLGRLDDAVGPRALVDGPGGARLVRESEVLEGQWRIDRIEPARLTWTWLPGGRVLQAGLR